MDEKEKKLREFGFESMDAGIIAQKKEEEKQVLKDIVLILKIHKEWMERSEKETICIL